MLTPPSGQRCPQSRGKRRQSRQGSAPLQSQLLPLSLTFGGFTTNFIGPKGDIFLQKRKKEKGKGKIGHHCSRKGREQEFSV